MPDKNRSRIDRQFDRMQRRFPIASGTLSFLRHPLAILIRVPLGLLLVFGGVFSFLPILGLWMLPLGLALLALDIPFLQRPVGGTMVRGERRFSLWRRARRRRHTPQE